jgi:asparagine synthase (glutamine-hydrolysing)
MAHGLEARVPFLDHPLVELAATIPADVKFRAGEMKHVLRRVARPLLPTPVMARTDKMGFPTPFAEWSRGPARDFVEAILERPAARDRALIDNRKVLAGLRHEPRFGRKAWGLLCLEIWHQAFHDRECEFQRMLDPKEVIA